MNKFKLFNINIILLSITLLIIIPKWIYSAYIFPDEDFLLKILYGTKGVSYFPLMNNISDLNFSPVYDFLNIEKVGIIGIPILNLAIISIFWKILGPVGFISLEIICVFLFFWIFCNIAKVYSSSKLFTFFIGIFFFSINFYLDYITLLDFKTLDIVKVNFSSFYGFRFPRPLISNLFLFFYIFLCFFMFLKKKENCKNFFYLSIISGLTLHIFVYFFII